MKTKDVPCINDEQMQIGIKLCDAVKRHPCLYDPVSPGYQIKKAVAAAWKVIGKECGDTAPNCRFRWKTVRSSFSRSFRKSGTNSQYYLWDHLQFLLPFMALTDKNDESTGQVEEIDLTQTDDVVSLASDHVYNDSDTTKSGEGTLKFNKHADKATEPDDQHCPTSHTETPPPQPDDNREGRPSRTRKLPKRTYEPESSPERHVEKRPRRVMERRKSVGGLVLREYIQKHNLTVETSEPEIPQPITIKSLENSIDIPLLKTEQKTTFQTTDVGVFAKPLMRDRSTLTESKWPSDEKAIQCDEGARTLDDEFLETLRPQIKTMNFRQKINFKQRVYLALMDVLDDSKNFPNDDVVELPAPLAKHFQTATSGELRLMRELVSLVQAAKMSSEIVNATDSVTVLPTSTSTSPPQNDDDMLEQTDEEPDVVAKDNNSNSPNKLISSQSTDSLGIPRHILQRAVQVTGNSGGTLLAQNGDKRRVYRIYPKTGMVPPQITEKIGTQGTPITATTTGRGTFFVTPPKPLTKPMVSLSSSSQSSPTNSTLPIRGTAIQYPKIIKSTTTSLPMLPPNTTKPSVFANGHTNTTTAPPKITINSHVPSANIFRRRYSICGSEPMGNSPVMQHRIVPFSGAKSFTPPPLSKLVSQPQQQQPKIQIQQTQPKMLLQQQLKMKQQHQLRMQQQQSILLKKPPHQSSQPSQQQHIVKRISSPSQLSPSQSNPSQSSPSQSTHSQFQISKPISLNNASPSGNNNNVKTNIGSASSTTPNNGILEGLPDSNDTFDDAPVLETAGTIAADSFDPLFSKPYVKMEPEE